MKFWGGVGSRYFFRAKTVLRNSPSKRAAAALYTFASSNVSAVAPRTPPTQTELEKLPLSGKSLRGRRAFELLGPPVGLHWYGWHHQPFDNDYPHYFPAKPPGECDPASAGIRPPTNGRLPAGARGKDRSRAGRSTRRSDRCRRPGRRPRRFVAGWLAGRRDLRIEKVRPPWGYYHPGPSLPAQQEPE